MVKDVQPSYAQVQEQLFFTDDDALITEELISTTERVREELYDYYEQIAQESARRVRGSGGGIRDDLPKYNGRENDESESA